MTRYAVVLLLIGSVMLGTGCTSMSTRAAKPDGTTPRYLYPGVECDINVITWPFVEQDHRCVMEILLWPMIGSLCLIDLPFSFVVDTVCLPYDAVMMTYGGRNRMGEKKDTVNEPDAGETPEGTLRAYFHYNDRGDMTNLRPIVAQNSLSMVPKENTQGRPARTQELRGIVVDHAEVGATEATIYFRSWFSLGTKNLGGRVYVGKLVKEDGVWKYDIKTSIQLTLGITKGKNKLGFYDGTKEWWK